MSTDDDDESPALPPVVAQPLLPPGAGVADEPPSVVVPLLPTPPPASGPEGTAPVATGDVGSHFQRDHRYPGTRALVCGRRSAPPTARGTRVRPAARSVPEWQLPLR
jgi:hypothetical protein